MDSLDDRVYESAARTPSPEAQQQLAIGDVVMIKTTERNRNCWPLGIIESLIVGREGVVRAARLRAGRIHLERAVQHLYPLELSCDREEPPPLNPNVPEFRPRRDAAVAARVRVQDVLHDE